MNNLKEIWKSLDSGIDLKSKDVLGALLNTRIKQTFNKFLYYIGFSAIVSFSFIIFLIISMISRWEDILYRINNLVLCIITLLALVSSIWSLVAMQNNYLKVPLKIWLEKRIKSISRWVHGKLVYFLIPVIAPLCMISISVYHSNETLIEAFANIDSVMKFIFGMIIGLIAAFFVNHRSRKYYLKMLNRLETMYKQLD